MGLQGHAATLALPSPSSDRQPGRLPCGRSAAPAWHGLHHRRHLKTAAACQVQFISTEAALLARTQYCDVASSLQGPPWPTILGCTLQSISRDAFTPSVHGSLKEFRMQLTEVRASCACSGLSIMGLRAHCRSFSMAPELVLSSGAASKYALCSTIHASRPCSDPSALSRSCRPI